MKQSRFLPIALIVTGLVLLLNQFNMLHLTRAQWAIAGSIALAVFLLRRAFLSERYKGLLGGVFFSGTAVGLLLMDNGLLPVGNETGFGMLLISLGLANFVYFVFTRLHTSSIVFGVIYSAAGAVMMLSYFRYIDWWNVAYLVELYWPALLILFGVALLVDGLRRQRNHRKRMENKTDENPLSGTPVS